MLRKNFKKVQRGGDLLCPSDFKTNSALNAILEALQKGDIGDVKAALANTILKNQDVIAMPKALVDMTDHSIKTRLNHVKTIGDLRTAFEVSLGEGEGHPVTAPPPPSVPNPDTVYPSHVLNPYATPAPYDGESKGEELHVNKLSSYSPKTQVKFLSDIVLEKIKQSNPDFIFSEGPYKGQPILEIGNILNVAKSKGNIEYTELQKIKDALRYAADSVIGNSDFTISDGFILEGGKKTSKKTSKKHLGGGKKKSSKKLSKKVSKKTSKKTSKRKSRKSRK